MGPLRPLEPQLDRYVRTLQERNDRPDDWQDLGTFLAWLLRKSGFTLRLPPFHYDGPTRTVSKGRRQDGVDVIATRPGTDGATDIFLFVLKRGNFGRSDWAGEKTMGGDLEWVRSHEPAEFEQHLDPDQTCGRVVVVAVHNGGFDAEAFDGQRKTFGKRLRKDGFDFEWWDAPVLVDRALTALGDIPDDQLFPPTIRAFYGAIIDGATSTTPARIDLAAIDRLLHQRLRRPPATRRDDLERRLTELSLFMAMLAESEPGRGDALLDLLDALNRVIPACMAAVVDIDAQKSRKLAAILRDLLSVYITTGQRLADALTPIAETRRGLTLVAPSERIDWPLRTVRILRDLALAARAAGDLAAHHRAAAAKGKTTDDQNRATAAADLADDIADRCRARMTVLAAHNDGALATPITDDQLIEYAVIWRTWLDAGTPEPVRENLEAMIERWRFRRYTGMPGPGLYQSAGTPFDARDARTLADTWLGERRPPEFEEGGSTLLPVMLFIGHRLGIPIEPERIQAFGAVRVGEDERPPIHPQSWAPPEDAPERWYAQDDDDLRRAGTCRVHALSDFDRFVADFPARQPALTPSPAQAMGLEAIDLMAWVRWRTRPPLAWLLGALPDPAPDDSGPSAP